MSRAAPRRKKALNAPDMDVIASVMLRLMDRARDEALEEAASVVEELRHRDIQMRDAVDAGEGYDLAIDEARVAIRALKGAKS